MRITNKRMYWFIILIIHETTQITIGLVLVISKLLTNRHFILLPVYYIRLNYKSSYFTNFLSKAFSLILKYSKIYGRV